MKTQYENELSRAITKGDAIKALACVLHLRREFKHDESVELSVNALYNHKKLKYFQELIKKGRINLGPQDKELIHLRILSVGDSKSIVNYYSIFENNQPSQEDLLALTSKRTKLQAREKLALLSQETQKSTLTNHDDWRLALGENLITP